MGYAVVKVFLNVFAILGLLLSLRALVVGSGLKARYRWELVRDGTRQLLRHQSVWDLACVDEKRVEIARLQKQNPNGGAQRRRQAALQNLRL